MTESALHERSYFGLFKLIGQSDLSLARRLCCGFIASGLLAACSSDQSNPDIEVISDDSMVEQGVRPAEVGTGDINFPFNDSVVLALNIGGDEYLGQDGILYQADDGRPGRDFGMVDKVKGSQDPHLFSSYRSGAIDLAFDIPNGRYDLILKYIEPDDHKPGDRLFDVYVEGVQVAKDLDVVLARDGNPYSALEQAVIGVDVMDGELNIEFDASVSQPLLAGLVVRNQHHDSRNWELQWSDEFDEDGPLNTDKWSFDEWPARKVNDEDQAYTSRAKNLRVENGRLIIEAHKEVYDKAEYTSGRIHSQGKGDFLYGKADIRAKIPAGQGTWSAIWMLPSDPFRYASTCEAGADWQGSDTCDAWPNSGEIDIMEHVGYDMHRIHGTVHNKAYYWINGEQRKASVDGVNVDEEFHIYSVEWTPEYISVFFDGSPYFFYANEGAGWRSWPFDQPFHLILNLAIGGAWGRAGGPIDDAIFPLQMEIDYVRVYSLEE